MYDFSNRSHHQSGQLPKSSTKQSSQITTADTRQSNDMRIFQTKRKVVYKDGDSIESAVLWDNNQKKYYKNMKPRKNSSKYIYGRRMGNIKGGKNEPDGLFDFGTQMYIYPSKKDRIGLNEILLEFDENHFVETNKVNMKVYDSGEAVPEEEVPFAIRLYSEGNMDHARGLSAGMEEYLRHAAADSVLPIDKMHDRKVLIKATEFRSLTDVAKAYQSGGTPPDGLSGDALTQWRNEVLRTQLEQEHNGNLEGSFGGRTGDMTREVPEGEHRLYDLIQTTFFWLQGYRQDEIDAVNERKRSQIKAVNAQIQRLLTGFKQLKKDEKTKRNNEIALLEREIQTIEQQAMERCTEYYQEGNDTSYQMMITFVRNQLQKLKPGGEIRIVVSNISPYAEIKDRLTPVTIAADEPDNPLYQNIEIEVLELRQTYPQQLAAEGLNSVGFEQRQTNKMSTVTGRTSGSHIDRDLIIIVHKRSDE